MVSEPRTYGFGFFRAAGFLARGRGAGFGATFARLSRMRAESTPFAARARFAAATSGCPRWSWETARLLRVSTRYGSGSIAFWNESTAWRVRPRPRSTKPWLLGAQL